VLGIDRIGIHNNFFEAGGNSLKVVALLQKLEAAYPGVFRINDLFSNPTISKQAEMIAEPGGESPETGKKLKRVSI
jgi:hypothetical protein